MNHEETKLISRCQQGDQEALKEIFDKYHKKVYQIAYGVVRHREEALDIVQEVFIKLYRSIKNFKGRSLFSFSSYRLLKEEMLTLSPNKPVSVPIPPGRNIELALIGQHRNVAEVRVRIKQEQTDILNTQVRLYPGRTVSIGGPKHGEGVIIITLSAQF